MKPSPRAPAGSLARLVERLSPGGRLVRMRRLRGGIGTRMHVLDIKNAEGARRKVTLRRFVPGHHYATPEHVAQEFDILRLVRSAGIAAPEPLVLDAEGELFGVPAMVLSYVPGGPLYAPRDERAWVEQLAGALLPLHAMTPNRFDLSSLEVRLADAIRDQLCRRAETAGAHGALARDVHAVLTRNLDQIDWAEPCLTHDDYWLGNTVWYRGRFAAIIDWTPAKVGDPRADVAQCRIDLAISHGRDVPDAFLEAYQRLAPRPLPDVWYFDLQRGLDGLLYYEQWLEGYQDFGLTHLTPTLARRRLEAFLRRALAEGARARS
ncbi:MAG: phosphotransferase [Dehalococcoidia bacterium]